MRKDCGALAPELPRYPDCGWEYCCRAAPLDEPGLPNPVHPRLFCGAAWLRGACWLPPGSPNRRHPPAASLWPVRGAAPVWDTCDRAAFCAGAAAVERLDMAVPDMARCCSANGTRAAALGC